MANLRRESDGAYPITLDQFEEMFPNISFGPQINYSDYGYDVVFDSPRPNITPYDALNEGAPSYDANAQVWMQTWVVTDLFAAMSAADQATTLAAAKADTCSRLADHRYTIETSGITRNSKFIPTTRDSQHNTHAALTGLTLNPTTSIEWSTPDGGFINVDLTFIQGLYNTIFTYVQACRAYEKTMYDQINALTDPRTIYNFDFTQGWPT